jgi:hypothetical protein
MATRAVIVAAALAALTSGACGLPIDYSKVVPAPAAAKATIAQIEKDWRMPEKPEIFWYGAAFLDCGDGTGFKDSAGTCGGGDQMNGQIIVALTGDPDDSALNDADLVNLAHELAHEASDEIDDSGCADHKCHWFRYTDGRDLLMEGMSPVYDGGDVDVEAFRIRALEVQ